jgi:hypothetical protein
VHYYASKALEINRIYAAVSLGRVVVSEPSADADTVR